MNAKKDNCSDSNEGQEVILASYIHRHENDNRDDDFEDDDFESDSYGVECRKDGMYIDFSVKPLELEVISYFRRFSTREQLDVIAYLFEKEEEKKRIEAENLKNEQKKYMSSDDLINSIQNSI